MRELSERIQDICDLRAYVVSNGLPDLAGLCDFIAQRIIHDIDKHPTDVYFALTAPVDGTYCLSGSVTVDRVESLIGGKITWLPNLKCFRGRVRIVPPPTESQIRHQELIDTYSGASQTLSVDSFYATVRDDGVPTIESMQLLKHLYGMMLSESLDVKMRYETRLEDR